MSDRIIVPRASDTIVRGSGVFTLSGFFSGRFGAAANVLVPYALASTADGGAIVGCGYLVGGLQYAMVMRLASTGSIVWARLLADGANQSAIYRVALDASGNIGFTGVNKIGVPAEMLVGMLSSSGSLLWQATYSGGVGYRAPGGINFDSSGNLYASADDSGLTTALFKFNSAGVLQWQRSINNGSNTHLATLKVNAAGTIVWTAGGIDLAGFSTVDGSTVQTIRYTPSVALGDVNWRSLNIQGSSAYLVGSTAAGYALGPGFTTAKIDLSGPTLSWDRHINSITIPGSLLECWQLAFLSGNLYAVGNSSFGGGDIKLFPFSINANTGAVNWTRQITYTAGGSDQQLSAVTANNSGLWLGWSSSVSTWGGGNINLLSTDAAAWPATLSGGAFAVSNPALVASVPGSTLSPLPWNNGPGTYVNTANGFALSSVSPVNALYPA